MGCFMFKVGDLLKFFIKRFLRFSLLLIRGQGALTARLFLYSVKGTSSSIILINLVSKSFQRPCTSVALLDQSTCDSFEQSEIGKYLLQFLPTEIFGGGLARHSCNVIRSWSPKHGLERNKQLTISGDLTCYLLLIIF